MPLQTSIGLGQMSTLRMFTILCLLALSFSLAARAGEPKDKEVSTSLSRHANGHRIVLSGVPNAGEVTPFLYRGAQPSLDGFQQLKTMGVELVVDLRLTGKDKERKQVTGLGMQYVSIPWHCYFPNDKVIAKFLMLLREHPQKKVFVHCRYGDDRTGMMIAAYRMANEGWTPEEARKEMEVFGFHHLVCPALGRYEQHFPEHWKNSAEFRTVRNDSKPQHQCCAQ